MIRLLIVDDSALMRRYLRQLFEDEADFHVDVARNGEAALSAMALNMPDVVTLDINMPEMDGLTCLSYIMERHPCPVIMVSSLTDKGALATLEALELGAVDYIAKPGGTVSHNMGKIAEELVQKVRTAAGSKPRRRATLLNSASTKAPADRSLAMREAAPAPDYHATDEAPGLVLLGVSTGGPGALETVLSDLPATLDWPLVITQHMPATFTSVLARRLNTLCALTVVEVSRPTALTRGYVYLAQGDRDLEVRRRAGRLMAVPVPSNPELPWHPSTDRLVESALAVCRPEQLIGVLLTGMGNDGAAAMTQLFNQSGHTVGESESTAVVYGMPKALDEAGGAELMLPLDRIGQQITRWVKMAGGGVHADTTT